LPKRKIPAKQGMNRYVWNLRIADAYLVPGTILWGRAAGPRVPPGTYQVRVSLGDWSETRSFEVRVDPRLDVTQEELEAQYDLARNVWSALGECHRTVDRINDVRQQVEALVQRLEAAGHGEGVEQASAELTAKLDAVADQLHQARVQSSQDVLNYPVRLDAQLVGLLGEIEGGDGAPTAGSIERYADLRAELDRHLADLGAALDTELAAFNDLVRSKQLPPIIVP
jgi:hypothetical protein